jgi:hypothetical protein
MVRMQFAERIFLRLGAPRTGQSDTAAVRGLTFLTAFLKVRTPDWTDGSRISRFLNDWWPG